jgi:hypothetical protein
MTAPTPIDTGNVTGRRDLHYQNLDELQSDVDALAAADHAGRLEQLGNWTLGQALNHLSSWINYGFDGYPMKVPYFIKMVVRLMKNKFLKGPLPAGKSLPGVPNGTFGADPISLDEGVKKMSAAIARLRAAPPQDPNPIFGPLTHDEWIASHLRHGELHLSFFKPS